MSPERGCNKVCPDIYHELAIQLKPDQIDHLLLEPLKDEQDRTRDAKELCKHQRVPTLGDDIHSSGSVGQWVPKAESQGLLDIIWFSYSALHLDSGQTSKLLDSIHVLSRKGI